MFDGSVKHSCSLPDNLRKVWGCEDPVNESRWALVCHTCIGEGRLTNGEVCPTCKGERKVPQPRCPNSTVNEFGRFAFDAYCFFKNYKILPQKGGMLDQSAYFLRIVKFCDTISSVNDKLREEHNERMKALAEKTKKRN